MKLFSSIRNCIKNFYHILNFLIKWGFSFTKGIKKMHIYNLKRKKIDKRNWDKEKGSSFIVRQYKTRGPINSINCSVLDKLANLVQQKSKTRHLVVRECSGAENASKHLLFLSFQILQKIATVTISKIFLMVSSSLHMLSSYVPLLWYVEWPISTQ